MEKWRSVEGGGQKEADVGLAVVAGVGSRRWEQWKCRWDWVPVNACRRTGGWLWTLGRKREAMGRAEEEEEERKKENTEGERGMWVERKTQKEEERELEGEEERKRKNRMEKEPPFHGAVRCSLMHTG